MKKDTRNDSQDCQIRGGVNSTALLIGLKQRGIRPDCILFADTRGERDYTYKHLEVMQKWCKEAMFPDIVIVKNSVPLYEECINNETLPSKAFGFSGCSVKHKRQPMDRHLRDFALCRMTWEAGGKVQRLIGIHAGESHRGKIPDDDKYSYHRPLVDWGWGQKECEEAISSAGMEVPRKSSCWFCPALKKPEIIAISKQEPELFQLCVDMEHNAAHNLRTVKGLGRNYSWESVVKAEKEQLKLPCSGDDGLEICDTCIDW